MSGKISILIVDDEESVRDSLYNWFVEEYPKHVSGKLDMGKSCIRFKNMNKIPFNLLGELVSKVTPDQWIKQYERVVKK